MKMLQRIAPYNRQGRAVGRILHLEHNDILTISVHRNTWPLSCPGWRGVSAERLGRRRRDDHWRGGHLIGPHDPAVAAAFAQRQCVGNGFVVRPGLTWGG